MRADEAADAEVAERWQSSEWRCAVVLSEVFAWLTGAELARAGAACRAWRRAAAEPALWRRLMLRHPLARTAFLQATGDARRCWRHEYVCAHAPWQGVWRVRDAGGAALLHAALTIDDDATATARVALAADDASVSIWTYNCDDRNNTHAWQERWRRSLRAERGWASAARVQWAGARRLLAAGPRALADGWELLVLHVDGECHGRVVSRARCSAGAAGCWAGAGGDAFLSLEVQLLAPRVACTTVWLNAATQETQSEHAGVRTRALRICNEDGTHISHVAVAEIPQKGVRASPPTLATPPLEADDDLNYYRAICSPSISKAIAEVWERVVVCAWGAVGEGGGVVAVWPLCTPRPPPLCATTDGPGDLRARRRVRAERRRERSPEDDAPPPDAAAVRALCDAPTATCQLPAHPLGLIVHSSGQCLWVSTASERAACVCVSLPALARLRTLRAPLSPHAPLFSALHYVQPAISEFHVAAPAGSYSSTVHVWSALSGAAMAAVSVEQAAGRGCVPVVCTVLSGIGGPLMLLVLAGVEEPRYPAVLSRLLICRDPAPSLHSHDEDTVLATATIGCKLFSTINKECCFMSNV